VTRAARAAAVPVGFALATAVLLLAGRGPLGAPPPAPDAFAGWASDRGATAALLALVRVAALAVAGWVAVLSTLAAVARAAGAVRVAAVAESGLPRVLRQAAGAGLASVAVLGGPAAAQEGGAAVAAEPLVLLPADEGGTATMSVLPDEPPPPAAAPAPAPDPAPTWTVAPGDSFWSIAEEVVADEAGAEPTEAAVLDYWLVLVDANRDRLVSGDPDLLLPGQVLDLPAVTGAAAAPPRSPAGGPAG